MEIFIQNLPTSISNSKLELELANVLHAPPIRNPDEPIFNFDVHLFQHRKKYSFRAGALTLPTVELGRRFLQLYGEPFPNRRMIIGATSVKFMQSNKSARAELVERVRSTPFQDPREAVARDHRAEELQALEVHASAIQFGCECRDGVYSIEWEKKCDATLIYDRNRREFRIQARSRESDEPASTFGSSGDSTSPFGSLFDFGNIFRTINSLARDTSHVVIRVNQIYWVSATIHRATNCPIIFFSLQYPPAFETESEALFAELVNSPQRQRWSSFDDDHGPYAPYTSLSIRLVCESPDDLRNFREFARDAHCPVDVDFSFPIETRQLFSPSRSDQYDFWIQCLPWLVAFRVEALLRSWYLNMAELLTLRDPIDGVLRERGLDYTVALLREFNSWAAHFFRYGQEGALEGFESVLASGEPMTPPSTAYTSWSRPRPGLRLEGPYPERSNRVMRKYYRNQDAFLRVNFEDENRLQLRFDREVDLRKFVERRVKRILFDGLTVAGAHFCFLAYSQSALKEHAVWFVRPFQHVEEDGTTTDVTAASIIASLGNFRNLSFDPQLTFCPARYAARISQAFTATEASTTVDVEDIQSEQDLFDESGHAFTDGVGKISPQLAREIWQTLQSDGRKDAKTGRIRERTRSASEEAKFESTGSSTIEIAEAFHKPGPYVLNRPLIMLLEGLGVPYEVFKSLQDEAVDAARRSIEFLEWSAHLLDRHGLGGSFRLSSALLGLHKLGLGPLNGDVFWRQMMDFAINHVLRELKHHARIPVPGIHSWTLVGIADNYGWLEEDEVLVCVDAPDEAGLIYLEGPILVSRSPTIHPGDVQVVQAVGRPPAGSPFAQDPPRNTVIFPIKGERSLPSCLGGGDLDGDKYNVTTRHDLLPTYHGGRCPPASYAPAVRKLLNRESTMHDVAEFVADYISSDTLGIIATNWLIIADQSPASIFDEDCLTLAELHSNAVDYPKSGQPVPIQKIPRLKYPRKPDWAAPETVTREEDAYYESTRAIGKLFRAVDLPALGEVQRVARKQRRRLDNATEDEQLGHVLEQFYGAGDDEEGEVMSAVRKRVSEFIDVHKDHDDDTITAIWELYNAYCPRLRSICSDFILSPSRSVMLTEEEAVVGTIVAKCSQRRKRKDLMSQMREQTMTLVDSVKDEIHGNEDTSHEAGLQRAWTAYRLAYVEGDTFGARSFAYIALSSIFDGIKDIEQERTLARRYEYIMH
ncbi:RdRP-domain-containing protein [Cerioporus squamosus]|nr:RdRP-domain-containing protein [Cerioporus squamosus]